MARRRRVIRAAALWAVGAVALAGIGANVLGPAGTGAPTATTVGAGSRTSGSGSGMGADGASVASASPASSGDQPGPLAGEVVAASDPLPADEELSADPSTTADAVCGTEPGQRTVEEYLARDRSFGPVTVDGVQSADDCVAIRRFQFRYGIRPVTGRADTVTADVVGRLVASTAVVSRGDCAPSAAGMTACVDLTLQTMWVVRDGAVVFGPTIVRTGAPGLRTPTGAYTVYFRNPREWSDPYLVWLPYWQNFNGGIGFHETVTYLHNPTLGSHGCVNLLHADAEALWNVTSIGTTVRVFGQRPGT